MTERILVVEDEPDLVEMVSYTLRQAGFTVHAVGDGATALQEVRRQKPALILLDLMLPDMAGTEVCRRIRRDPEIRDVPIVMMTAAFPSVDDADRGLTLGADEYVVKPFLREVLVHNVERLLAASKQTPL
jgi:two-component system phosphate regulon response regulator PhoB